MTAAPRRAVIFDAYPHVYAGAQRISHLLATRLPAEGWDVEVVVPGEGAFPERLRADGLAVRVVATPPALSRYGRVTTGLARLRAAAGLPRYWWRLSRELGRARPDLVHVADHRGLVLAAVPARMRRLPVVWHVHAIDPTRRLNRWGGRVAAVVLVPSAAVVDKLPGLDRPDRVRTAASVVPAWAASEPIGELATDPVVVTVARLHPDKGLDLLVDALAEVRRSVATARLRVVGGPQEGFEHVAEELRQRAERLGLADAVELLGFVPEPQVELRQGRCYVQASREQTEILPLAILEAMAAGVPVVATDVGGVRDVVQDERTGILVAPEDVTALAQGILRVLQDADASERLRIAAHALVTGPGFRAEDLVATVAAAYAEAIDG